MSKLFISLYIILLITFVCSQDVDQGDEELDTGYSVKKTHNTTPSQNKCLKGKYGLKKLMNQEVEMQYCFEHGGRTCCNNNDVLPVRQKMGLARHGANPKITDECFAMTSRVMCSKCDADISTGQNSGGQFCLTFCDQWFLACLDDFVDPYQDPNESVPFCKDDSLVCSKVQDIVQSSRGWCEYMGYKVFSPDQMESEENKDDMCYTGYPRQLIETGKIPRTKKQRTETPNSQWDKIYQTSLRDKYDLFMNSLRLSPLTSILERTIQPMGYLALAYIIYSICEGFYMNSKARKKAVYENCAQQAKMKVAKQQEALAKSKANLSNQETPQAQETSKGGVKRIIDEIKQKRKERQKKNK